MFVLPVFPLLQDGLHAYFRFLFPLFMDFRSPYSCPSIERNRERLQGNKCPEGWRRFAVCNGRNRREPTRTKLTGIRPSRNFSAFILASKQQSDRSEVHLSRIGCLRSRLRSRAIGPMAIPRRQRARLLRHGTICGRPPRQRRRRRPDQPAGDAICASQNGSR